MMNGWSVVCFPSYHFPGIFQTVDCESCVVLNSTRGGSALVKHSTAGLLRRPDCSGESFYWAAELLRLLSPNTAQRPPGLTQSRYNWSNNNQFRTCSPACCSLRLGDTYLECSKVFPENQRPRVTWLILRINWWTNFETMEHIFT